MKIEMLERLAPFRAAALKRGIPSADVERWIRTARPCATLTRHGDGPVVGTLGGPLLLPADAPDPWYPLVAAIDLAALPADATDLPLPPDGRLLLFAYPDTETDGEAVYVPAGTAVEERKGNPYFEAEAYADVTAAFPRGPLHLAVDVSLPYHCWVEVPDHPYVEPLPGHPHSEELRDTWLDTADEIAGRGVLQIGGYASDESSDIDPVLPADESRRADDWVLLADWYTDIKGREGATVHWAIRRADLAARRFDQTDVTVFWNP
ncbi:DUF1963 domain-containing protein [Actinomadura decatromicini]|nr:DUF1963 domain-containing protein [Actinomadura decatromicini]